MVGFLVQFAFNCQLAAAAAAGHFFVSTCNRGGGGGLLFLSLFLFPSGGEEAITKEKKRSICRFCRYFFLQRTEIPLIVSFLT